MRIQARLSTALVHAAAAAITSISDECQALMFYCACTLGCLCHGFPCAAEQSWSEKCLTLSLRVCQLWYIYSPSSLSICLSAACPQVFCPSVQASNRHAHPAVPDIDLSLWAIVQIFLLDMEGGHRGHASGQRWHEDLQWAHRLDEGWNLTAVKQVSCPRCQDTYRPDLCTCLREGVHCISSEVQRIFASCKLHDKWC